MNEHIKNIEKLADVFGTNKIQDFHDAEIVSILFNRENGISIEVILQIRKLIEEFRVDEKRIGHWKNANCTFQFSKVNLEYLQYFNHQNVINDLCILPISDSVYYSVYFESIFGCELKFDCEEIELTKLEVFETEKESFEPSEEILILTREARKKLKNS